MNAAELASRATNTCSGRRSMCAALASCSPATACPPDSPSTSAVPEQARYSDGHAVGPGSSVLLIHAQSYWQQAGCYPQRAHSHITSQVLVLYADHLKICCTTCTFQSSDTSKNTSHLEQGGRD